MLGKTKFNAKMVCVDKFDYSMSLWEDLKKSSGYSDKDMKQQAKWRDSIHESFLVFDSMAEAKFYVSFLVPLMLNGEISNLEVHPTYTLQEKFTDNEGVKWNAIVYESDFSFVYNGKKIVVDIKGLATDTAKLKRKMFLYIYRKSDIMLLWIKEGAGKKFYYEEGYSDKAKRREFKLQEVIKCQLEIVASSLAD